MSIHGALYCGSLRRIAPNADLEAAKDAAEEIITTLCTEFFGLAVEIAWQPGTKDSSWVWPGATRTTGGH